MRPVSYLPTSSPPSTPPRIRPIHEPQRIVRRAVPDDLRHTAALHRQALPAAPAAELGARFVARWHRAFLDSPHGVALVTIEYPVHGPPRLIGFLIGATDQDAFRRDLLALRGAGLAVRGAAGLLRRPRLLADLRPYPRTRPGTGRPPTRAADLAAVAVAADARRAGVGQDLVEAFLRDCAAAGTEWVELTAPAPSGEAHAFCRSTGWVGLDDGMDRGGGAVRRFGRLA